MWVSNKKWKKLQDEQILLQERVEKLTRGLSGLWFKDKGEALVKEYNSLRKENSFDYSYDSQDGKILNETSSHSYHRIVCKYDLQDFEHFILCPLRKAKLDELTKEVK